MLRCFELTAGRGRGALFLRREPAADLNLVDLLADELPLGLPCEVDRLLAGELRLADLARLGRGGGERQIGLGAGPRGRDDPGGPGRVPRLVQTSRAVR